MEIYISNLLTICFVGYLCYYAHTTRGLYLLYAGLLIFKWTGQVEKLLVGQLRPLPPNFDLYFPLYYPNTNTKADPSKSGKQLTQIYSLPTQIDLAYVRKLHFTMAENTPTSPLPLRTLMQQDILTVGEFSCLELGHASLLPHPF